MNSNYTKYVDPLIGTGLHGHVFVGASVPFGDKFYIDYQDIMKGGKLVINMSDKHAE